MIKTGDNTRMIKGLLLLAALMLVINTAQAEGNKTAGAKKARSCQVCHGKGGRSTNPTYPVLAGQHAQYLEKQLQAYKDGTRADPIMSGVAVPLSGQDMADIAAYFQSNH
jgi:cytochrome c553